MEKNSLIADVSQLVSIKQDAFDILLLNIEQEGKEVVLKPELSQQIANFKLAQKRMKEVEDELKKAVIDAMGAYGAKKLTGRYTTISVSSPRTTSIYKLQEGFEQEWGKQEIKYVPDVERIEEYIEKNNEPPVGVSVETPKPTVTIRLKNK